MKVQPVPTELVVYLSEDFFIEGDVLLLQNDEGCLLTAATAHHATHTFTKTQPVLWSRNRTFLLEPEPVKMNRLWAVAV